MKRCEECKGWAAPCVNCRTAPEDEVRVDAGVMAPAVITYPHNVGGLIADRRYWMALVDGEVYDYDTVAHLKQKLENEGRNWKVVRRHRDGTKTIMETGP